MPPRTLPKLYDQIGAPFESSIALRNAPEMAKARPPWMTAGVVAWVPSIATQAALSGGLPVSPALKPEWCGSPPSWLKPAVSAMQAPLRHVCPAAQRAPQVAQLSASVEVSTQPVLPGQTLDAQLSPMAQAWPQAPQLPGSLVKATQPEPQMNWPATEHVQTLLEQTCPLPQVWPHAPQLDPSLVRLAQPEPHMDWPAAGQPQEPPEQTWPAPQACPHEPQFAPLVARSTQAVPHAVPEAQVQAPPLQDCAEPQA